MVTLGCQRQQLGRSHLRGLVERVHQLVLVALEVFLNHVRVGEVPDRMGAPVLNMLESGEHLFVREPFVGAKLLLCCSRCLSAHMGRGHHDYQRVWHRRVEQKSILH